jgi:RNA polymerase-binding transcription factor DksA
MFGATVNVQKIALTSEQVAFYNPPPNPTKVTDTRSSGYIAKHGNECWEVDALPPDVLHALVERAILHNLDTDAMDRIKEQEDKDKDFLKKAVSKIAVTDSRNTGKCLQCGNPISEKRADSRYCSQKCKQKAYRERALRVNVTDTEPHDYKADGKQIS